MRFRSRLAVLALILSSSASPARAAVCLDTSMTLDEIADAIDATPGCAPAMKLFEACAFGTSGYLRLGAAVEKKCEGDFWRWLKPPQARDYQRDMAVCDGKYRNESGTMYRSFTAFCRAQVAQRYARKAAGPSRAR